MVEDVAEARAVGRPSGRRLDALPRGEPGQVLALNVHRPDGEVTGLVRLNQECLAVRREVRIVGVARARGHGASDHSIERDLPDVELVVQRGEGELASVRADRRSGVLSLAEGDAREPSGPSAIAEWNLEDVEYSVLVCPEVNRLPVDRPGGSGHVLELARQIGRRAATRRNDGD